MRHEQDGEAQLGPGGVNVHRAADYTNPPRWRQRGGAATKYSPILIAREGEVKY